MIYLNHLLKATNGVLYMSGKTVSFAGFSHDTRQLEPGEMFVAVRGTRGHGHDYLLDAAQRDAGGLLVEARMMQDLPDQVTNRLAETTISIVVVEDTRIALQEYAHYILKLWQPTVIAVSGSVGKTSTKEAVATVLANKLPTFRSWQNYNDLLGIPLSLGRLEAEHRYAVLELGCDHPGEIDDLCRIVEPQIGILTNIQPALLQYFGSIERLAAELGRLLSNLPAGGTFFYNQHDQHIQTIIARYKEGEQQINLAPFGSLSALEEQEKRHHRDKAWVTQIDWAGLSGILETGVDAETAGEKEDQQPQNAASKGSIQIRSHLLGAHHLNTMLAAYEVGVSQGMAVQTVVEALSQLSPQPGRLHPLPGIQHARLLDDTHNASPAALLAGLATLDALTPVGGRRIAVIGDMQGLGAEEAEEHRRVGRQAAGYIDYLITRGEHAEQLAEAAQQAGLDSKRIIMTSTHEDAAQAVRQILRQESPHHATEAQANDLQNISAGYDVILIKGSEETRMERVSEMLMARPWEASEKLVRQAPGWKKTIFRHADRPTWVEIDLNAIAGNTQHIKALVGPQVQVLVSLKADAYGHGAIKVARTVLHNGASMLGVATVTEAVPLREAHISAPILVFGYVPLWQMREAVRIGVTVTLYSSEAAQALSRAAVELNKSIKVHVKVDTGMGRLGIRSEKAEEIIDLMQEIRALPGLELEGLYTHFAQADASDRTYTERQLARFQHILELLENRGLRPALVHAANSAGTLTQPAAHFDMVRPGIIIYGLAPSSDVTLPIGFRPALSFKTQVSQEKWIPAGEGISYGSTYITEKETHIAVLPVGYADGFRRSPQNWGKVLIHGQEAPLVGRVCMDQCMIDVTNISQTRVGDEVVLIGHQGEATLTAEQVAERLGTINYEVVAELLARVPRVD